jgi:hypothetical protein
MKYWEECISEAFDEAGIIATEDQINTVVSLVEGAHENYGMAHGHDCIPNPLLSDVKRLEQQIKCNEESHERQLRGIKQGVALRRNVSVQDVSIDDDGLVTYRP